MPDAVALASAPALRGRLTCWNNAALRETMAMMRWLSVIGLLLGCGSKPAPPCQGVEVIEKGSGARVLATAEEAQRGILQGDYRVAADRLRVRGHGKFGSVATQDLAVALGQGNELADPTLSKDTPSCKVGNNLRRNRPGDCTWCADEKGPAPQQRPAELPPRGIETPKPNQREPEPETQPPTPAAGADGLYRVNADACGLEALSPTPLEHSQKSATANGRTATVHEYRGRDWWGMLSYSCTLFDPPLTPQQELITLVGKREDVATLEGAKLLREREVFIGSRPAMEIDTRFGEDPVLWSRWHLFFAGGALHIHTVMTTKQLADEGNVGDLLDGVELTAREPSSPYEEALGVGRRPLALHGLGLPTPGPTLIPKAYSCKGDRCSGEFVSRSNGRPKTVRVRGYFKKDGTYVNSHMRSAPRRH